LLQAANVIPVACERDGVNKELAAISDTVNGVPVE
jgi:hypothetical protein